MAGVEVVSCWAQRPQAVANGYFSSGPSRLRVPLAAVDSGLMVIRPGWTVDSRNRVDALLAGPLGYRPCSLLPRLCGCRLDLSTIALPEARLASLAQVRLLLVRGGQEFLDSMLLY